MTGSETGRPECAHVHRKVVIDREDSTDWREYARCLDCAQELVDGREEEW